MIEPGNRLIVWSLGGGIIVLVILGLIGMRRLPIASSAVLAVAAWFGYRLYNFIRKS